MDLQDRDLLVRTATLVEEMHDLLLGNGQPGKITVMENDINHLLRYKSWIQGIFAAVWVVVGLLGFLLGHHILYAAR